MSTTTRTTAACADTSRTLAEPLAGTAAAARAWLLVEQPGPWGAKALTGSHLDPELGRRLDAASSAHGVRTALIRRPGRHADAPGAVRRRVFLAHTEPGASWIRTTVLDGLDADPSLLTGLDFASLGAGTHCGLWEPYAGEPLVLVCTNGKRDRCCALRGRPLAAELASSGGADVWEVTHLGGHRFAPTLLTLPYGYAYGRATAGSVKAVVDAVRDGHVLPEGCRGRSTWDRPGQAADLAVRRHTGIAEADALTVRAVTEHPAVTAANPESPADTAWTVTVAHRDGRAWQVTVRSIDGPTPAPASCGAAPDALPRMNVDSVTALEAA